MSALEPSDQSALTEVDLLLFEIGGELYGADAAQVLRIELALAHAISLPTLGASAQSPRALVIRLPGEPPREGQLRVDLVCGVRQVQVAHLRRMPPAASARPWAIGLWLDGARPVVLIDLEKVAAANEPPATQVSTQVI